MAFKRKRTNKRKRNFARRAKRKVAFRRKRMWRKRSRGTGAIQRSIPSANFLPQKCVTTLRYSFQGTMDANSGTKPQIAFSANGAYDPDQSGVGNSLPGWQTYADFYGYYCVIASKMTVTILQNGTLGSIISINLNDTSSATSTVINDMWEQKNFVNRITTANNNRINRISKGFSIKKDTGISSPLSHLPLQASTNMAPSWHFRYHLIVQGCTPSTDPGYITFMAVIKYRIIFLTPKIQQQL